jgi:very-short-patch-repair endonuclease
VTSLGVLPITNVARTAIDLARECTWPWAVVAVDSAMRLGTSRGELVDIAGFCARWRGGTQAMRAAEFARPEAQSAAESFARAIFEQHGLPAPELQVKIYDEHGAKVATVDFLFRGQRTVVETDGKIKYLDPWGDPREVLWREKLREDRIRDLEYEVVRVTWEQLMNDPEGVIARVRRAFARSARLAG